MRAWRVPSALLVGKCPRVWSQIYPPKSRPETCHHTNQINPKTIPTKHITITTPYLRNGIAQHDIYCACTHSCPDMCEGQEIQHNNIPYIHHKVLWCVSESTNICLIRMFVVSVAHTRKRGMLPWPI
mmetsp:Transcript_30525/g.49185  ORF Transcript_30525/g.49185 Transcript_30525/m.49185 type:complete len:127 (-) Transcript_30525:180-560(-)